jgi:hypothetical protein
MNTQFFLKLSFDEREKREILSFKFVIVDVLDVHVADAISCLIVEGKNWQIPREWREYQLRRWKKEQKKAAKSKRWREIIDTGDTKDWTHPNGNRIVTIVNGLTL